VQQLTEVDYNCINKTFLQNDKSLAGYKMRKLFEQAKEMEREQHGNTWDAAIKAHDDRGHVHARSLTDFDDYEFGS
jgi:hypothetical protein